MKTVTLDDILIKPGKVSLSEELSLWVRPLTQIERDICQAFARRASRSFRSKLEDSDSEEYGLLIADELAEYGREQLEALWIGNRLVSRAVAINRQSLEDRDQTYIPEPEGSDITNAELEKHETAVEEMEAMREDSVQAMIVTAREQLVEEAAQLPIEELESEAAPALIEHILSNQWLLEFNAQMICRATFTDEDCTKPAFKTISEVKQLRPEKLELLTSAHYGQMVDPESVKN